MANLPDNGSGNSHEGKKPTRIIEDQGKKASEATTPIQVSVYSKPSKSSKPSFLGFVLTLIYKELYILGITLMRKTLRAKRKVKRFLAKWTDIIWEKLKHFGRFLKRKFSDYIRRIKAPFLRIGRTYREELPTIKSMREDKKFPFASYKEISKQIWKLLVRIFATILNILAPIWAVLFLINTVHSFANRPLGLEVKYGEDGEVIGYIENERDFSVAVKNVNSRIVPDEAGKESEIQVESSPEYNIVDMSPASNPTDIKSLLTFNPFDTLKRIFSSEEDFIKAPEDIEYDIEYTNSDKIADGIIQASSDKIEPAYGVYIGGNLLGSVKDKDAVFDEFDSILEKNKTGRPNEKQPEFLKVVSVRDGLYPSNTVKSANDLLKIINSGETTEETYEVKEGDTPESIAKGASITVEKLEELNPDADLSSGNLKEGQKITTTKTTPFLSVKNIFTDVYLEELEFEVEEVENSLFAKSYRQVEIPGVNGLEQIAAEVTYVNGIEISRDIITRQHVIPPKTEKVTIGVAAKPTIPVIPKDPTTTQPSTPSGTDGGTTTPTTDPTPQVSGPAPRGESYFIWPTSGGGVSCRIWGYPGHTGLDIDRNGGVGSPVYASASGVVTKAVNSYVGYGKHIKIDHGNGFETLYAHNDVLHVSVGDYVYQGQIIAKSGRTGRVTGPHVHFEVILNGNYMDPLNYINMP